MDFRSGDIAKPWASPSRAEIEVLLPVAKSKNSKIGLGELRELTKYIPPETLPNPTTRARMKCPGLPLPCRHVFGPSKSREYLIFLCIREICFLLIWL